MNAHAVNCWTKILANDENEDLLGEVMPDDQARDEFLDKILLEDAAGTLTREVLADEHARGEMLGKILEECPPDSICSRPSTKPILTS